MWEILSGRKVRFEVGSHASRRLAFHGTASATLKGFEAMWTLPSELDLSQAGSMFADDAFVREEYVQIDDLIRKKFKRGTAAAALVCGAAGTGKSAFLQYLVARLRKEARDVLVVRGHSFDNKKLRFLHLSTSWFGAKTATILTSEAEALRIQDQCEWTIVDDCDWEPIGNFAVGAASPSTPWTGFSRAYDLLRLCMPPWSLTQLEQCAKATGEEDKIPTIRENYELVGGVARWAFQSNVRIQVDSAIRDVNFETLERMASGKADEKEVVPGLVLWKTALGKDGIWMYRVTDQNPIRYSLLSPFVSKQLARKAAALGVKKHKLLSSEDRTRELKRRRSSASSTKTPPLLPFKLTWELFERLKKVVANWAEERRMRDEFVFYWDILSDDSIKTIVTQLPMTFDELCGLGVLGENNITEYGNKIVLIVTSFIQRKGLEERANLRPCKCPRIATPVEETNGDNHTFDNGFDFASFRDELNRR